MFEKGSRYKDLPEISTPDAYDRVSRSKTLRRIPDTPGIFLHTANQADRLDLLAYRYYGDPRKWWLICDGNPDFALPTDLLDRDPITQEIFVFMPDCPDKWPDLIRAVQALHGVRKVLADIFLKNLDVTYNSKEITRQEIIAEVAGLAFEVREITKKERIGQKIVIPPNRII